MIQYISEDGLEKLKNELKVLKNVKRGEIAKKLKEAASFGDLSENSEYTEAKENQAFTEGRIQELENILKEAVVIKGKKLNNEVTVGSIVETVCSNDKETFIIVGAMEVSLRENKISSESPLGMAFIGKRKGELVIVETPAGEKITYKIIKIK